MKTRIENQDGLNVNQGLLPTHTRQPRRFGEWTRRLDFRRVAPGSEHPLDGESFADVLLNPNLIEREPKIAARLSVKIRAWLTQEHPTWKPKLSLVKKTGASAGPPLLL